MKEYGCCPKFKRGGLGGVALTRYMTPLFVKV
jgi:hypothetical protein